MHKALKFFTGGWLDWLLRPAVAGIEPVTLLALATAAGVGGSLISGNAASKAQGATNATNLQIAQDTNAANLANYLLSRGINTGIAGVPSTGVAELSAQFPELRRAYDTLPATDTRTFEQWVSDHIAENPDSYIAQAASASGTTANAVNTVLPLWATVDGQPAEQALFNRIIQTGLGGPTVDATNPSSFGSVEQVTAYLSTRPDAKKQIAEYMAETGQTGSVEEWLSGHIAQTGGAEGYGGWGTALREFANETNAAAEATRASASQIPAEYQALIDQSRGAVENIYNGTFLTDEMNALAPALDARLRLGELAMERNTELRDKTKNIYDADLTKADTYGQAAMEAVNRVMAQNKAKDAVRGYSGGSSMSDLTSARTLAPAIQAGAGARAQAGVDYQTRLASILDADAATVAENAKIQNALDKLGLTTADITRKTGSVGLAGDLYNQKVGLENLTYGQQFRDLDATLARLNTLNTGGVVSTPNTVVPSVSTPLSSGQIAGAAVSNLGSAAMDYFTTQSYINALKGSGSTIGSTGTSSSSLPLFTGNNFNYTVGNYTATPAPTG